MPCELEKAGKNDKGEDIMMLKGIASTKERDADGEILDPKGFDLTFFKEKGFVNWHHGAKFNPKAIIGEPTKALIKDEGFYVEAMLYPASTLAKDVYEFAEVLKANSTTRKLGFSVEGKAIERDPNDETKITKAKITGLAVTHMPKNVATMAEIMKGDRDGLDMVYGDEEDDDVEKKEKALAATTGSGQVLKPESLEGSTKHSETPAKVTMDEQGGATENLDSTKGFTKGEVMKKIFSDFPDITIEKAKQVCDIIIKNAEKMSDSKDTTTITDEAITKAYGDLGLKSDGTPIEKGTEEEGGSFEYKSIEKAEGVEHDLFGKFNKGEDGKDGERADDKSYIQKADDYVEFDLEKGEVVEKAATEDEDEDDKDKKKKKEEEVAKAEAAAIEKAAIEKGGKGKTFEYTESEKAGVYHKMTKGKDDKMERVDKFEYTHDKKAGTYSKMVKGEVNKGDNDELTFTVEIPEFDTEGFNKSVEDTLEKALGSERNANKELFKAVGTILQDLGSKQSDFQKSMEDKLETLFNTPLFGRKSFATVKHIEKAGFGDEELNGKNGTQISLSTNRPEMLAVLGDMAFSKGEVDDTFGKALQLYEASGQMQPEVKAMIKAQKGLEIVD